MKLTQVFSLSPANKSDGFPINPMLIDFSSMGVDLFKNIMLLVHQHTSEMGFHFKIYDRITGLCFLVDLSEHLSAYKERLEEEIQVILNRIEGINVSNDHSFAGNVPNLIKALETTQYMLNKVNREIERKNEGIVDVDFPEAFPEPSPDFRSQDEKEFCDTLAREAGQDAVIQKQYEDPGKEFWDMSARDADDDRAMEMMGKGCNILASEVTPEIAEDTRLEKAELLLKEAHLALQGAYANLASNTKPNMKRLIFDTMAKVKKHSRR